MNTNIGSYLKTVEALESGDRILSVTPLEDGTGYTIIFSKTGTITIYNGKNGNDGKNGDDGSTPEIGVKLDADGTYYWTVNGEYLLDNDGNKIAATAHISKPQVHLSADGKHYEISFDNGATWMTVGDVAGSGSGDTIFTNVIDGANEVTFYLTDGSTIIIPKLQTFALIIDDTQVGVFAGQITEIMYTVSNADDQTIVDGIANNGYSVSVSAFNKASGVIEITPPDPIVDGKAIIMAVNGNGVTSGKILSFEKGQLLVYADGLSVGSSSTTVTVQVKTNLRYEVSIPDDASAWCALIETKSLRTDVLTFSISENTGSERTATINLLDDFGGVLESFTIVQSAGGAGQEPGYYNNINDWEYDDSISF